jgi:hypothetical protein
MSDGRLLALTFAGSLAVAGAVCRRVSGSSLKTLVPKLPDTHTPVRYQVVLARNVYRITRPTGEDAFSNIWWAYFELPDALTPEAVIAAIEGDVPYKGYPWYVDYSEFLPSGWESPSKRWTRETGPVLGSPLKTLVPKLPFDSLPMYTVLAATGSKPLPELFVNGDEDRPTRGWDLFISDSPDSVYDEEVGRQAIMRGIRFITSGPNQGVLYLDDVGDLQEKFPNLKLETIVNEARRYGMSFAKLPDTVDVEYHRWYLVRTPKGSPLRTVLESDLARFERVARQAIEGFNQSARDDLDRIIFESFSEPTAGRFWLRFSFVRRGIGQRAADRISSRLKKDYLCEVMSVSGETSSRMKKPAYYSMKFMALRGSGLKTLVDMREPIAYEVELSNGVYKIVRRKDGFTLLRARTAEAAVANIENDIKFNFQAGHPWVAARHGVLFDGHTIGHETWTHDRNPTRKVQGSPVRTALQIPLHFLADQIENPYNKNDRGTYWRYRREGESESLDLVTNDEWELRRAFEVEATRLGFKKWTASVGFVNGPRESWQSVHELERLRLHDLREERRILQGKLVKSKGSNLSQKTLAKQDAMRKRISEIDVMARNIVNYLVQQETP